MKQPHLHVWVAGSGRGGLWVRRADRRPLIPYRLLEGGGQVHLSAAHIRAEPDCHRQASPQPPALRMRICARPSQQSTGNVRPMTVVSALFEAGSLQGRVYILICTFQLSTFMRQDAVIVAQARRGVHNQPKKSMQGGDLFPAGS